MCEHRTISLLTGLCFDCGHHCLSIKLVADQLSATLRVAEIDGVPTDVPESVPGCEDAAACGCCVRCNRPDGLPSVELCAWHRRNLG